MNLEIPVTKENKFYKILVLLKPLKPFKDLTNRQIELFSEILFYYDKYKNYPLEERHKLVFDKSTYVEICTKLKITDYNLYNLMVPLRKATILTFERKGTVENPIYIKKINPNFLIPADLKSITFNFKDEPKSI